MNSESRKIIKTYINFVNCNQSKTIHSMRPICCNTLFLLNKGKREFYYNNMKFSKLQMRLFNLNPICIEICINRYLNPCLNRILKQYSSQINTEQSDPKVILYNYVTDQSPDVNSNKLETHVKNVNIIETFLQSSENVLPFNKLDRTTKKNLIDQTSNWTIEQLRYCYNYRYDKLMQKKQNVLNFESSNENKNQSTKIPIEIKNILLDYIKNKAIKNQMEDEDEKKIKYIFPMKKKESAHWHEIRREKQELLNKTGLTLKQLNDQLRLLSDTSSTDKITKKTKEYVIQFLKVRNFEINNNELHQIQKETNLTYRQVSRLIKRIKQNRIRNSITQENKLQVEKLLSSINFQSPNKFQRSLLKESTGLETKQLNELILRIRRKNINN